MFTKILIAEDEDSDNLGIVSAVREHTHAHVATAQFCDKTLLKIKEALQKERPYELLISDLSFMLDYKKTCHHHRKTIDRGSKKATTRHKDHCIYR